MSSLLTNVSAMTALQTLRMTNEQLGITQGRVATGMRVASASDNAAYWAIATTMRADNMALSSVKDALGLSHATLNVMIKGLEKAVDLVKKIKAKLITAKEDSVNKDLVQQEIGELQKQLVSIGSSAVFNEQNWLKVDSENDPSYNETKNLVASFRRIGNSVTVESISIDISGVSLFDGANGGLLGGVARPMAVQAAAEAAAPVYNADGLTEAEFTARQALRAFVENSAGANPADKLAAANAALGLAGAGAAAGNEMTQANVDAMPAANANWSADNSVNAAAAALDANVTEALARAATVDNLAAPTDQYSALGLTAAHYTKLAEVADYIDTAADQAAKDARAVAAANALGLDPAAFGDQAAWAAAFGSVAAPTDFGNLANKQSYQTSAQKAVADGLEAAADAFMAAPAAAGPAGIPTFNAQGLTSTQHTQLAKVAEHLQSLKGDAQSARLAEVNAAIQAKGGEAETFADVGAVAAAAAADFEPTETVQTAAQKALSDAIKGPDGLYASAKEALAGFDRSSVDNRSVAGANAFSIRGLTNSADDKATIDSYVRLVENSIGRITGAAARLGAIKNRITTQKDFVNNMMDAIKSGIGQLVDADMNAQSARLKALQVQQQLGIQALSIANASSQNILSLFR